jgi:TolB-like protein/class 3 adenylate cyclase
VPPSQPTRSLAAIVFTDVVGYSALMHRDDDNALRLVAEHFKLVRELARAFGGQEIKTIGDSVMLKFGSAQAATQCAIAIQQAHQKRNTQVAAEQQFEVRIGVHLGDIEHRDGDVFGDGVNVAARLQPLAPVGGIAISGHVRGQLREALRSRFTSVGSPDLKNISTPIEVFAIEAAALAEIAVEPVAAAPMSPSAKARVLPLPRILAAAGVVVVIAVGLVFWKSSGPKSVAVGDKSIAVLPFVDMSQAKDQEYFSDGIAEDLLNLLTKVQTLQVAARTSSFSFKGKDVGIEQIAVALRVAHVLQGSVRKSGNQVRITAQLVRAADGYQIWSQSWDRQMDDVFKIQDEIAQAVVDQLKVQLLGQAPTAKPVDAGVYPLILQAEAQANLGTREGWKQAVVLYRQALALAPNEARAWAGLARTHFNQIVSGTLSTEEGNRLAKEAANKAIEIDPGNAIALVMLASLASEFDFDLPAAARYYERALALEPGNLIVLNSAAVQLMNIGRLEESQALFEYRLAHDPANPIAYNNLANNSYYARKWQTAIDTIRAGLKLSPDLNGGHFLLGMTLLIGKRDAAAALKEFEAEPDELSRLQLMPLGLYALGRKKEADAALKLLLEKGQEQPSQIAAVYAYRGELDAAFEWLDKAVAAQDFFLSIAAIEPIFDPLRNDPRWLPFLRKIGYAPEQLARIELKVTMPAAP